MTTVKHECPECHKPAIMKRGSVTTVRSGRTLQLHCKECGKEWRCVETLSITDRFPLIDMEGVPHQIDIPIKKLFRIVRMIVYGETYRESARLERIGNDTYEKVRSWLFYWVTHEGFRNEVSAVGLYDLSSLDGDLDFDGPEPTPEAREKAALHFQARVWRERGAFLRDEQNRLWERVAELRDELNRKLRLNVPKPLDERRKQHYVVIEDVVSSLSELLEDTRDVFQHWGEAQEPAQFTRGPGQTHYSKPR